MLQDLVLKAVEEWIEIILISMLEIYMMKSVFSLIVKLAYKLVDGRPKSKKTASIDTLPLRSITHQAKKADLSEVTQKSVMQSTENIMWSTLKCNVVIPEM